MTRNWIVWFLGLYWVNNGLSISTKGGVNYKLKSISKRSYQYPDALKYSGFKANQENKIVEEVNNLKSRTSEDSFDAVSNKVRVIWSDELANLAKDWGDQCKREFGPPGCEKKFSQNRGSINKSFDEIHLLNEWANDSNYTYETNKCNGNCDSFKNIVWAESYAIGCSKSSCENLGSGHFMICNIYPPADTRRQPYIIGEYCAYCSRDYVCVRNFCDKEDKSVPKEVIDCIQSKESDGMNAAETRSGNGIIAIKATLALIGLLYPLNFF
ncbi:GLIPR1-like protein 1 [Centruroides sculpturatus]|uniref:GLIPR1-like protein 1 n=1 Tax=Centruroides sculpturatus TaxID=218467 RepID=UPI000C6DBE48|nr:GLIPR1-like protein 1 [Centruroides sculpturatus]XP_023220121.1 GLIPR1-like protein 1 [Centruroides sculpturatus]